MCVYNHRFFMFTKKIPVGGGAYSNLRCAKTLASKLVISIDKARVSDVKPSQRNCKHIFKNPELPTFITSECLKVKYYQCLQAVDFVKHLGFPITLFSIIRSCRDLQVLLRVRPALGEWHLMVYFPWITRFHSHLPSRLVSTIPVLLLL